MLSHRLPPAATSICLPLSSPQSSQCLGAQHLLSSKASMFAWGGSLQRDMGFLQLHLFSSSGFCSSPKDDPGAFTVTGEAPGSAGHVGTCVESDVVYARFFRVLISDSV